MFTLLDLGGWRKILQIKGYLAHGNIKRNRKFEKSDVYYTFINLK